jgi:hypothetical protein
MQATSASAGRWAADQPETVVQLPSAGPVQVSVHSAAEAPAGRGSAPTSTKPSTNATRAGLVFVLPPRWLHRRIPPMTRRCANSPTLPCCTHHVPNRGRCFTERRAPRDTYFSSKNTGPVGNCTPEPAMLAQAGTKQPSDTAFATSGGVAARQRAGRSADLMAVCKAHLARACRWIRSKTHRCQRRVRREWVVRPPVAMQPAQRIFS